MGDHALAAFAMLRADAAEETNLQDGLTATVSCVCTSKKLDRSAERPLSSSCSI
jgi:hypothetical protein